MSNLKFKSPYTQKEYELEAFEKEEGNVRMFIVSHNALKNLLNVELRAELEIKYEVKMLLVGRDHCVAQCTIVDKSGKRSQEIGESTAATLETKIAKGFPATTAWNRALDRCIIAHLGFKGRVYSTEEIAEGEEDNITQSDVIPETPQQTEKEAPAPENEKISEQKSISLLGNTIVKLARYAGSPQKLSVLWKSDAAMVHWICDNYTPSCAEAAKVKEACIKYREMMKGKS